MKKHFQLLFSLVISLSAFAQEKTDTISKKRNKWNAGIFISAGINNTKYNSDILIKYLFDKTGSDEPASITCPYVNNYVFQIMEGSSTIPDKFNYHKLSLTPILNIGMDVKSMNKKKIAFHHLMEVGYMKSLGKYSYTINYYEGYSSGPAMGMASIHDTVQTKYSQTILTFGYKFQPAFKSLFLSFGINGSLNLFKVVQQKKEQIECWSDYEQTNPHYDSQYAIDNKTSKYQFVNIPIQIGAGYYIKIKKLVLKPAFYFTPNFIKGYNFYNISVAILHYRSKK